MYASYIIKRTQIYLDESQHERLSRRARTAGTTKSDLIREAVDAYLAGSEDGETRLLAFRTAVRAAAGTARRLPRGRDYVEEFRRADAERVRDLDDQRRT
ncbi:MAG: ribbon-helix-helix domain-containing protein [Actinomycetota bacterium]|nr:ribbon-helix-helix domain-containing protein [Actinomycetota bacterium]